MRRIILGLLFTLLALPATAQSLNDQVVLSNDGLFVQRVKQAIITAAVNISSDGLTTGVNIKRHVQVQNIMSSPDSWKSSFAGAIATQATVMNPATSTGTVVLTPMLCPGGVTTATCTETGNADARQALVSDAVISTAVAGVFNAFFGGQ